MIVTLHGMPGAENKDVSYETGTSEFRSELSVRVAKLPWPRCTPHTADFVPENERLHFDVPFCFWRQLGETLHYVVINPAPQN